MIQFCRPAPGGERPGAHAGYQKGMAMTDAFKVGDKVQWHSSQGTVHGTIKKKLTAPVEIKVHHVAASPAHPEYLVVSDSTGAQAAHKPEALTKS